MADSPSPSGANYYYASPSNASPHSVNQRQPSGLNGAHAHNLPTGSPLQALPPRAPGAAHPPQHTPPPQNHHQMAEQRPHGGGFVPIQQQLQTPHRPHGGDFVPEARHNSPASFMNGNAYGTNPLPQGQGNTTWQGIGTNPRDNSAAPSGGTLVSKGAFSTVVPLSGSSPVRSVAPEYVPPRKRQREYRNLWNDRGTWRWKFPNAYQLPGLRFENFGKRHHRDVLQRVMNAEEEDRYLSPWDGHLSKLVVQAVDDVYDAQAKSTWRRTFVRNVSSPMIRIAVWAIDSVPYNKPKWSAEDWLIICAKWVPACLVLTCLMPYPSSVEGEVRNQGFYDTFPYRYWGYAKYWRNNHENHGETYDKDDAISRSLQRNRDTEIGTGQFEPSEEEGVTNPITERLLQPRYLCFLDQNESEYSPSALPMKVQDWMIQTEESTYPDYLFVAWTAEHFQGPKDLQALAELAEKATREAGLSAYWISSSCMPDPEELEQDVYRISDVIRGAKSLAIIVGHPVAGREEDFYPKDLLAQWGKRMWTLPEALLSPKGNSIRVYVRGLEQPWDILKANFAHTAWHDAPWTRQLIDHYEGSLILSPLELVVLALRCLNARDMDRYSHFPGDLSYVLMGLLRRRPKPTRIDTAFQAFARLSLANDNNMLLERLVCVHPKDPNSLWLSTDDAWDAQLWDIYPSIQVAGVGHDDTVILDGAFGAAIRWKSFTPVAYLVKGSWKRLGANTILRASPLIVLIAIILLITWQTAGGVFLLIISLPLVVASPYLVRVQYGGKLWGTQPWFFGFEGYLDIATIEESIFGAYLGRLTWSSSGSPLSRHSPNEFGECVGIDATTDPEIRYMVERARNSEYGEQKIFTLVDTYTLTVTMFSAVRPPVAALLCASEGGMQRAVMCSYHAETQTLYRESVLRMETPVLQKMNRVGRFRFGFQRPLPPTSL